VAPLSGRCLDGTGGAPDLRTPETLARGIWGMLGARFGGAEIARVRLAGDRWAVATDGGEELDVTRTYEFSAAHRLHSRALSEAENARVFGKCNNPSGHGHNYVLEVTLRGRPDASGEVLEAPAFDRIVNSEIVDRWDHKNLNDDVPEFSDRNPTAEEIARVAWNRLADPLDRAAHGRARLHRIRVRETERNHVEYLGD